MSFAENTTSIDLIASSVVAAMRSRDREREEKEKSSEPLVVRMTFGQL
jgi:hypothetical protein